MIDIGRRLASILAVGVVLAATPAGAGPATDQVKAAVEQVLQIVQDPELSKPEKSGERRAEIRQAARRLFSFEEMAKRSLARHWGSQSAEQQTHFTELFTDLLENSYVSKIEAYGGETIEYLPEQASGERIVVRSVLTTKSGTQIPIDYRMQKQSERWEVYDVLIEGVSLVANYRAQFNKIITQDSYEELVKRLEQKRLELAEERRTRGSSSN